MFYGWVLHAFKEGEIGMLYKVFQNTEKGRKLKNSL